jgi:NADP-dependent 3-hydroxy acid dehydrogenase YdfG
MNINNTRTVVVVITGVTSGVGLACTKKLLSTGCKVIGIARRKEKLIEMKETLGQNFYPICADVRDKNLLDKEIKKLPDDFSNIDKLINGAGLLQGNDTFLNITDEQIDTMISTNIRGSLNIIQLILPKLIESGQGHIVNITSIGADVYYPTGHIYASTKAFLAHFGRCLRSENINSQVRLTNVAPGKIHSEFAIGQFNGDKVKANNMYNEIIPLQPDDIAETISWVLSTPPHININSIELVPAQQNLHYR